MSSYYLLQDIDKCIGCQTCEMQCKIAKGISPEPKLCKIVNTTPKWVNSLPMMGYVYMNCFHCDKPNCVAVCPTGAMQKRDKDGIVFIQEDLCVGCKLCIHACPIGAPAFNPSTGKVVKCDLCKDRIDAGLQPNCVEACPVACLSFGKIEEISENTKKLYENHMLVRAETGQAFLNR